MRPIIKNMIVLAVCLAVILPLVPALGAKRLPSPRAAGVSYLSELERRIYRLTNEVRRKQGLPALAWERSLNTVARAHSVDMLLQGYISHVSPNGKSPHDRVVSGYPFGLSMSGENIWGGSGHDPGDTSKLARIIVDNWMSSPGHRRNLMNPNYTDIGVGVAVRGKDIRATQVFVRTKR